MTEHFIIFPHLFIGKSSTNKKHQPNIIQIEAQYANEVDLMMASKKHRV